MACFRTEASSVAKSAAVVHGPSQSRDVIPVAHPPLLHAVSFVIGLPRHYPSCGGSTQRYPTSVLSFSRVTNDDPQRRHPHQKPLELLEYLIRTFSNPGDLVLDNTMGSGATGVACLHTGRNFIGIEKSARYFSLAEGWILSSSCPAGSNMDLRKRGKLA